MRIGKPVDPWFGYGSEAAFRRAVDAELDEHDSHSRGGGLDERRSGQRRQTGPRLRGKPGSAERLRQMREMVGDDSLVQGVLVTELGNRLAGLIQSYADGRNGRDTVVRELARLSAGVDPQYGAAVREMVSNALGETGDYDAVDQFEDALGAAWERRAERDMDEYVKSEQQRMGEREKMLKEEVRRAARKHGRDDAEFAAQILGTISGEELYSDALSDEDIQTAMRSAAKAHEVARTADSTLNFLNALDREIAHGIGAPGSNWSDEERAQWEAELHLETAGVAAKKLVPLDVIEADARASIDAERRGTSDFMDRVMAEAERMTGQTDTGHRDRAVERAAGEREAWLEERRQEGWR